MAFATTQKEWQAWVGAFLKAKMKEDGVTYAEFIKRLEKHGFKETKASITMKLKRGTFPATFFLAALAALEIDGLRLKDISPPTRMQAQDAQATPHR